MDHLDTLTHCLNERVQEYANEDVTLTWLMNEDVRTSAFYHILNILDHQQERVIESLEHFEILFSLPQSTLSDMSHATQLSIPPFVNSHSLNKD